MLRAARQVHVVVRHAVACGPRHGMMVGRLRTLSTTASTSTQTRTGPNSTEQQQQQVTTTARPLYAQALELFLDTTVECSGYPIRCAGFDWTVAPVAPGTPIYHWTDEQSLPGRIARVEIASPYPDRIKRFAEIHFDAWFVLLHQHDLHAPYFQPKSQQGYFDSFGQWSRGLQDLANWKGAPNSNGHDVTPLDQKPFTLYHGLDIPARWIAAFKRVYWPAQYQVPYDVSYIEFFRDLPVLSQPNLNISPVVYPAIAAAIQNSGVVQTRTPDAAPATKAAISTIEADAKLKLHKQLNYPQPDNYDEIDEFIDNFEKVNMADSMARRVPPAKIQELLNIGPSEHDERAIVYEPNWFATEQQMQEKCDQLSANDLELDVDELSDESDNSDDELAEVERILRKASSTRVRTTRGTGARAAPPADVQQLLSRSAGASSSSTPKSDLRDFFSQIDSKKKRS